MTGRRVGRPPIPIIERKASLHVKLPPALYDEYCRRARREGVSVSALIRVVLRAALEQLGEIGMEVD